MRTRPQVERELRAAEEKSLRLSQSRASLPVGSSRARVTTANARWMRAAEHRDRLLAELKAIDTNGGKE